MVLLLGLGFAAHSAIAPGGAVIRNVATASYIPDGFSETETVSSNAVVAEVLPVEALVLTQDQAVERPPGAVVTLSHVLTNTGNVASTYTINFTNNGSGCSPDTLDLSALRVVRDSNNNGVIDAGDAAVQLGARSAISLRPGESAVLLVQGTTPASAVGVACLAVSATTELQGLSAVNRDTITVSDVGVLSLVKSASYPGMIVPGQSRIAFSIFGTSIGVRDVQPSDTVAPVGVPLRVNGVPRSLVLVRDTVPAGAQYVAGSLQSTAAGAIRLYRLPVDPPFSYRTNADDASAVEVAIGVPTAVARNASIAMQFEVLVKAGQEGDIVNTAQGNFANGVKTTEATSNTVVISTTSGRIGVAKAASALRVMRNADGSLDGTATVHFTVKVRNYGAWPLYNVQLTDVLEGAGATQFGSYTSAVVPTANQYTIVAGSLALVNDAGRRVSGTVAAVNPGFNGTAVAKNLLAAGAVLPVGAEVSLGFDVRFNTSGRSGTLENSIRATGALMPNGGGVVYHDSLNGFDPNPAGDGNPNTSWPTPVPLDLPVLSIVKSASPARPVGQGRYDVDYSFLVTNKGSSVAPNVRVIDNFNCAFDMDKADGAIASWELVGAPRVRGTALAPALGFTGRASCNREAQASSDPFRAPTEASLNLTDGTRSLAPGQSVQITVTVRLTQKPNVNSARVTLINKAWALALSQNTTHLTPNLVQAAAASSAQLVLADPQGTVYNAVTREPVAGALVTYTRQSCRSGPVTPITTQELYRADSGDYTFNPNGSVSMTTGADGSYLFLLASPPVTGLCTYTLSVTPPVGSGYVAPSRLLPASAGSFSSCGAVVPQNTAPKDGHPTTHYLSVEAGFQSSGAACDVFNNHLPLDPGSLQGLVLRKDGSKRQAELGDFIDYALTVSNKTGFPIKGVTFNDSLPTGFAYIANSARLNDAVTPNPVGGAGPQLVFNYPDLSLKADESATVRYRLRIGVGAPTEGDAVNRARAISGPLQSNQASWSVRVTGGVFSDEAFLFGKVFMTCKRAGDASNTAQMGVPGVRLYLENGSYAISDVEGKWSLYGLKPITHVLRLDQSTLPVGARLRVLDNRNSGSPESRFVDLKKGELHRADFAIENCDEAMVADVAARRELALKNPAAESEAQVRQRLDAEGKVVAVGDLRALPASGQSGGMGGMGGTGAAAAPATSAPLIALPAAPANASAFVGSAAAAGGTLGMASGASGAGAPAGSLFAPLQGMPNKRDGATGSAMLEPRSPALLAVAQPSAIALEELLPKFDNNALAFVELKDGDTVASQTLNVRVKGEMGGQLRLTVNEQAIEGRRVGKKTQLASKKVAAWEYIGVQLQPGQNRLRLEVVDDFGNVRGAPVQISVVAPDKLAAIQIDLPATAYADARTPAPVTVRLVDSSGVPITARTQLTLEADRGRWLNEDLNPSEPGTQVFMEGGKAEFKLLPPGEPGDVRIRVSVGTLVKDVRLAVLPEMRPMIGLGIVEGVLDFTKRGKLQLGAMPAGAAFETELSGMTKESTNSRAAGRAAWFFKGTVKGEYLLTTAYDSDKTQKDRLFRDIRPDEFYPVYGDSSAKGFDAQSTEKLYVRIDKNRSYLLYGDFATASSPEVRSLSQTSRSLTGVKNVYEGEKMRATTYASRTAQTQQVEEFRAVGTSGPYYLSGNNGEFVDNSEQIEILVRDRNQPSIVLQRTGVARFVDYTIEPLTRRILFTHPIASVDPNLNPQSIRVTYEVDSGGPKYTVAGTDVQVKVNEALQVGVVASTDQNPQNQRKLSAVTALARLGDNTTLAAEAVSTQSDLNGNGSAGRLELRHQTEKLAVVGLATKTSEGFDNPSASVQAGRTEANVRAEYKIDPATGLRADAFYSKDALTEDERKGASLSLQRKLSDTLVAEAGVRQGQTNQGASSGSSFDYGQLPGYSGNLGSNVGASSVTGLGAAAAADANSQNQTTVRARVTSQVPGLASAQVFVEGEQDVQHSDRHALGVGGNYAITDKTRAYGRYQLISSLQGPDNLDTNNVGIVGIESNYMEGGRVYNEYRLADSIDGRAAQAAVGVRNTVKVTDALRLTGGVEHTRQIGADGRSAYNNDNNGSGYNSLLGRSTAITSGVEYFAENYKLSGIFEARNGDDSRTRLFSAGYAYKIDPSWSLLARSVVSDSVGEGSNAGNERHLQRHQIGLAYRPVGVDTWNALARYERREERVAGNGHAAGAMSGNVFGNSSGNASLPGTTRADIVSAHVNYQPVAGTVMNARYAGKISRTDDGLLASTYWAHLLQGRLTYDLSNDWDFGVQAGVLYGQGGAVQKTAGIELGYQVAKNLWASVGYNFVGLNDRDLTANEYTSKGVYIRLRYKFDETTLGLQSQPKEALVPAPQRLPEITVNEPIPESIAK